LAISAPSRISLSQDTCRVTHTSTQPADAITLPPVR
jgi:hypothetical protein